MSEHKSILNIDDINTNLNKILKTMDKLDINIEKINKKIKDINTVYMKFEFNKSLPLNKTNTYLKFQVDLLHTEKKYYKSIKKVVLNKISNDIFEIAESTILILLSLENIKIYKEDEIKNIMKKAVKINKNKFINFNNILVLINSTVKNLQLIGNFINLIDNYIKEVTDNSLKNNIHTTNFSVSLSNKKNHIKLEYEKYCEQLNELLQYFLNCSNSILLQLNKQELFKFFVNKQD